MSKDGTIHLVYQRQYYDDEDMDYFFINFTIFRNVPLSQLNRLNNKEFKQKVKEFCDKNYKETATNDTGYSEVNMITGDEYYKTYGDEFGETGLQKINIFMKIMVKSMTQDNFLNTILIKKLLNLWEV